MIVAGATAYSRIIDPEPLRKIADSCGALFMFDAAHIAGLIVGGVHPNPMPYADIVTFTTHKTLRGPRGGCILSATPEIGKKIDSAVFPGLQGGPLEHVIAGKAVAFHEAAQPEFKAYAQQIVKNAQALAGRAGGGGLSHLSAAAPTTTSCWSTCAPSTPNSPAKSRRKPSTTAGITLNKNTIPDDPRSPFVTSGLRIGTPSVTTAGMTETEMPVIARLHRRSAAGPRRARVARHDPQGSRRAVRQVPALPQRTRNSPHDISGGRVPGDSRRLRASSATA